MKDVKRASEELLAAPLPEMIKDLGLAVAAANKALNEAESDVKYTIPEAEVELKVAISIKKEQNLEAGLSVSMVNAAYSSTYGFSEDASSRIFLRLQAVPARDSAPAEGDN